MSVITGQRRGKYNRLDRRDAVRNRITIVILLAAIGGWLAPGSTRSQDRVEAGGTLSWIQVSADKQGFVLGESSQPFVPWGFNYDHDETGRLIEDYWRDEWPKVEEDFAEM